MIKFVFVFICLTTDGNGQVGLKEQITGSRKPGQATGNDLGTTKLQGLDLRQ